jgi:hypothetical protein
MEFPEKLFPFPLTETDLFTLQPAKFLLRDEAPNLKPEDALGESQVTVINNTRQWPNNNQQGKTEVTQRRASFGTTLSIASVA